MQNFNEIGIRFLYKISTFIGGAFLKSVTVLMISDKPQPITANILRLLG